MKINASVRLQAAKRTMTPAFVETLLKGFGVNLPELLENAASEGFGAPKVRKTKGDITYTRVPNSVAQAVFTAVKKKLGAPAAAGYPEWEHDGLRITVRADSGGKDTKFSHSNSFLAVRDLAAFTGYNDNIRSDRTPRNPR